MPGIVRVGKDSHIGHASGSPNAFHRTSYATGSPNVFTNDAKSVRIGDTTACTDAAVAGSGNVYVNNIPVHRLADATQGHASWVPNAAATSSGNVFANGGAGTPGSVPEGADVASNDTIANQTVSDPLLIYSEGEYTHPETSVCTAFNFTAGECGD